MQNLDRFLKAQASSYDAALREICAGQKRSHWIWCNIGLRGQHHHWQMGDAGVGADES